MLSRPTDKSINNFQNTIDAAIEDVEVWHVILYRLSIDLDRVKLSAEDLRYMVFFTQTYLHVFGGILLLCGRILKKQRNMQYEQYAFGLYIAFRVLMIRQFSKNTHADIQNYNGLFLLATYFMFFLYLSNNLPQTESPWIGSLLLLISFHPLFYTIDRIAKFISAVILHYLFSLTAPYLILARDPVFSFFPAIHIPDSSDLVVKFFYDSLDNINIRIQVVPELEIRYFSSNTSGQHAYRLDSCLPSFVDQGAEARAIDRFQNVLNFASEKEFIKKLFTPNIFLEQLIEQGVESLTPDEQITWEAVLQKEENTKKSLQDIIHDKIIALLKEAVGDEIVEKLRSPIFLAYGLVPTKVSCLNDYQQGNRTFFSDLHTDICSKFKSDNNKHISLQCPTSDLEIEVDRKTYKIIKNVLSDCSSKLFSSIDEVNKKDSLDTSFQRK